MFLLAQIENNLFPIFHSFFILMISSYAHRIIQNWLYNLNFFPFSMLFISKNWIKFESIFFRKGRFNFIFRQYWFIFAINIQIWTLKVSEYWQFWGMYDGVLNQGWIYNDYRLYWGQGWNWFGRTIDMQYETLLSYREYGVILNTNQNFPQFYRIIIQQIRKKVRHKITLPWDCV
jgi:hypothetical protein